MLGCAAAPLAGAGLVRAQAPVSRSPAPAKEHWAYVKPVRPELPAVARPGWVRSPIDRFVLARLESEKLSPAAEAGKATLLRRATLDLTGLPPTPEDLDAFVADRSNDAYTRVVDRLLASPHYGERWARPWLDLARYADTNGHEKDNRRAIWKYRDWVIDALNRDLPFDTFTIEQIAGDMLPDATVQQKIASGFHRNAMTNEEGGVDPDESRYEVLVDRVNTTATVWLGTTLACAQCHNHKYDPFTQRDYFRFLAFFANGDFESRTFGDGTRYFEPTLDLATPDQEAARKELQARVDQLDRELKTVTPAVREAQEQWEQSIRSAERAWTPLAPRTVAATNGVELKVLPDGSVLASGANPPLTSYTVTADTTLQGITGVRVETIPDPSLPRGGPGRDAYGHFRVTGIHVMAAPASESGQPPRAIRFEALKVNDSASAFEPRDLIDPNAGTSDRKRGSWAINAMRDAERVPRHAVLAAAAPFGAPGGTRITVRIDHLDGTIGQGIGRFTTLRDRRGKSARGGRPPGAGAAHAGAAGGRAQGRTGRRARRDLPLDEPVVETRTRGSRGGAEGARRSPDSLDAGDEGAPVHRATVVPAPRARKLCCAGRARVRPHAWRASPVPPGSTGQPTRPRALAGRPGQPARRPRRGESTLGAALRAGTRGDERGLRRARLAADAPRAARLAGHRVRGKGLEPESRCSARSCSRPPTGSHQP